MVAFEEDDTFMHTFTRTEVTWPLSSSRCITWGRWLPFRVMKERDRASTSWRGRIFRRCWTSFLRRKKMKRIACRSCSPIFLVWLNWWRNNSALLALAPLVRPIRGSRRDAWAQAAICCLGGSAKSTGDRRCSHSVGGTRERSCGIDSRSSYYKWLRKRISMRYRAATPQLWMPCSGWEARSLAFFTFPFHGRDPYPISLIMQLIHTERSTLISKQKLELVLAELSAMPEDVPTYKQIGKAWVCQCSTHANGRNGIHARSSDLPIMKTQVLSWDQVGHHVWRQGWNQGVYFGAGDRQAEQVSGRDQTQGDSSRAKRVPVVIETTRQIDNQAKYILLH